MLRQKFPTIILAISGLSALCAPLALGAACCGSGSAAPATLSGEDRAQISLAHSVLAVSRVVDTGGFWARWPSGVTVQSTRLEGAHLLSDRWQAGASIPFVQTSVGRESGAGDLSLSLGFESLPDWDYHPWRPRGVSFLRVTAPTGQARALAEGMSARGNGFWAVGLGQLLEKSWGAWDAFLVLDAHRSLPREMRGSRARPGWGGSAGLGAGFHLGAIRLGASLLWFYEDAVEFSALPRQSLERYATASLALAYSASEDWSASLAYTDQTLFGHPVNTSLGRGAAFQLTRRWGR